MFFSNRRYYAIVFSFVNKLMCTKFKCNCIIEVTKGLTCNCVFLSVTFICKLKSDNQVLGYILKMVSSSTKISKRVRICYLNSVCCQGESLDKYNFIANENIISLRNKVLFLSTVFPI